MPPQGGNNYSNEGNMITKVIIDGNEYTGIEETGYSKDEMADRYYKSLGTVGATLAICLRLNDGSTIVLGHDAVARAQWIFTD